MTDGECYIQYNATTIYGFPQLNCSEGSTLPSFNSTRRETFYIYNGQLVKSRVETLNNQFGSQYTDYVAHINHNTSNYRLDFNYLILPATLLVLCFFFCIYKWFIRLRG